MPKLALVLFNFRLECRFALYGGSRVSVHVQKPNISSKRPIVRHTRREQFGSWAGILGKWNIEFTGFEKIGYPVHGCILIWQTYMQSFVIIYAILWPTQKWQFCSSPKKEKNDLTFVFFVCRSRIMIYFDETCVHIYETCRFHVRTCPQTYRGSYIFVQSNWRCSKFLTLPLLAKNFQISLQDWFITHVANPSKLEFCNYEYPSIVQYSTQANWANQKAKSRTGSAMPYFHSIHGIFFTVPHPAAARSGGRCRMFPRWSRTGACSPPQPRRNPRRRTCWTLRRATPRSCTPRRAAFSPQSATLS